MINNKYVFDFIIDILLYAHSFPLKMVKSF